MRNKKFLLAVVLSGFITMLTGLSKARDIHPQQISAYGEIPDSIQASIDERLSFYESEMKKNNEIIEQLQVQLEQRKLLKERLSGAIAAASEIKQVVQVHSPSAPAGVQEQVEPNKVPHDGIQK